MRAILFFAGMLLLSAGCEFQSPYVKYVNGITPVLYYSGQIGEPKSLDLWRVSENGEDIYGAGFAFIVEVKSDSEEVAGIKVICEVESYFDPWSTTGEYQIWDKPYIDATHFGLLRAYPEDMATEFDCDTQKVQSKTNMQGKILVEVVLGDPYTNDPNLPLWPGGDNDMYCTVVQLKFTVKKNGNPLTAYAHAVFIRASYMDFWQPSGGVFGYSYSAVGKGTGIMPVSAPAEGEITAQAASQCIEMLLPEPKPTPEPFSIVRLCGASIDPNTIGDPNTPFDPDFEYDFDSPDCPFEIYSIAWCQYDWDDYYGWGRVLTDTIVATDPIEDLSQASAILSYCQPYTLIIETLSDNLWLLTPENISQTIWLSSYGPDDRQISRLPIEVHAEYINYAYKYVCWVTERVVPINQKLNEGRYFDYWDEPGTFIFVPEGGYMKVSANGFYGDYNKDQRVDWQDFDGLAGRWLTSAADPNYNFAYDANADGTIGLFELGAVAENWLDYWTPSDFGDFNDDGDINLVDFAMLSMVWDVNTVADPNSYDVKFDSNYDESIDIKDAQAFSEGWLK